MELAILMLTVGSAVVEIKCGSIYRLEEAYTIFLNGEERGTTQKVVTSLFNLSPDRDYLLQLAGEDGSIRGEISHRAVAPEPHFVIARAQVDGHIVQGDLVQ